MFAYVDRISDILVRTTAASASEWHAALRSCARDTVRSILAGEPIDEELAVQRLGYELRRTTWRCGCRAVRVRSAGWSRPRARPRPHWDR